MALIACNDRVGEVSSEASACPKCGRPVPKPLWTKQASQLVVFVFAIIGFLVLMAAIH